MASSDSALVDVLIAGDSAAGQVLALSLAAYGVRSTVLVTGHKGPADDAALIDPSGDGIAIDPDSVGILDRLTGGGATELGAAWRATRVVTRRLDHAGQNPDLRPEVEPRLNIGHHALHELLDRAVDSADLVQLAPGQQVVRLTQDVAHDPHRVHVQTVDATARRTDWSARFVVGADGPESAVRDLLALTFDGADRSTPVLVADIAAELGIADERAVVLDPVGGGWLVELLPMPADHWRLTWALPPTSDLPTEAAPDALRARVAGVLGEGVEFELLGAAYRRARLRAAPQFSVGRVFLVGAAAHTTGVFGGYGPGGSIQDADNLAWKLAFALAGQAGPPLLDSYDAERRLVALEDIDAIDAATRTLTPRNRWAKLRRRGRIATAGGRLSALTVPPLPAYGRSPVIQPGCGGLAPALPVRDLDGGAAELRDLRGGPVVVAAIAATVADALDLAGSVAGLLPSTGLPPLRMVAGAAADATDGIDLAGTALGNLLVVRPDGRFAWKVNGENEPVEVAQNLTAVLQTITGR
jgi:2-polyprenyl-6-methoxyphenol hydroxylase-like FAD-dependent oxidoreductase